jgi:tetratricopeptide (TPR) repeat protein
MKWLVALVVGCAHAAAQKPPATVKVEIDAAETAEKNRHHEEARAHYEAAVAAAHDPKTIAFARHEYAETLETWGEVPAAIMQLDAIVKVMPDDAHAWHDLGILRQKEHDITGAIDALEHAKKLVPRMLKVRIALAAARQCANDRPGAIGEYKELLDLDLPDRLRAAIRQWLGVLERTTDPLRCVGGEP